jgi:hypothetical protein
LRIGAFCVERPSWTDADDPARQRSGDVAVTVEPSPIGVRVEVGHDNWDHSTPHLAAPGPDGIGVPDRDDPTSPDVAASDVSAATRDTFCRLPLE